MIERHQRALDRLDCMHAVLEADGWKWLKSGIRELCEQGGEAVRVLAEDWPQEYPDGVGRVAVRTAIAAQVDRLTGRFRRMTISSWA